MAAEFRSIGADDRIVEADSIFTLSPGAPSGVVSGDLLITFLYVELGGPPTTPTGWTFLDDFFFFFNTGKTYVYWRIADGTGTDTPTISIGDTPALKEARAIIMRVDGHDATTPIDTYSALDDETVPITHPSITIASADSLAIIFGATYITETGTYTFGNSFTQRFVNSAGDGFWIGTKDVGAGATGTTDVTCTTTLIRSGAWTIGIAPAAGGTVTITGTGSHQATTATHSATGERTITGTASHSAQTATHSAIGEREITAIAAHVASTATHSASGTVGSEITGSASHQAQTSTHAATGEREITATASHSAQTATHTATAERIVTGIAAHVANTATHSATGSVGNVVSGTGAHSANDATHSAIGLRVITGSASHQAESATHSATGNVAGQITGTAAHQAQRATSTGVILRVITGAASHQATTATQEATDIPLISLPLGPFTVSDITPKRGILDTTNINSILKLG